MKIKIIDQNAAKIESALAIVNKRSGAHCYTTFKEICQVENMAEHKLSILFKAKKDFVGAVYTSESGCTMPNAYKGKRNSTVIGLYREPKNWFLVDVKAGSLFPNQSGYTCLYLTPEQDQKAVEILKSTYRVRE